MMRFHLLLTVLIPVFLGLNSNAQGIGNTLYTFDMGSLTPTPDRSIVGIEYADGYIWATGFDPDDYWQHKLYKFSPDGSQLVDYYSYGIEAAGWKDMAFDGEFLYVNDIDTIRQIDLSNGQKTGLKIPAPFYYTAGLAYNPLNDHFYLTGDGGSNIYEIDRDGNIVGAVADNPDQATVGLAIDTVSPGGPFLWTWSNEEVGYGLSLRASQISLQTGEFTGLSFEGISISNIIAETAGGATIAYDWAAETTVLMVVNIRNGNAQDQMEYAVFYDITNDQVPGPQISVNPLSIQNNLPPGDSLDVEISVYNQGNEPLNWTAYIETPEMDTVMNPGDTLYAFNATINLPDLNTRLNGITWLDGHIWLNGRGFGNVQSKIYKLDKYGQFVDSFPYYAINNSGFTSITSDGEYLYADDTYAIIQIDPNSFTTAGYILKPGGSYSGMTYDPQKDHFWLGNGNGLIYEINRDGEEVNEYITPYDVEGLAWDNWSPGGPYLWVWTEVNAGGETKCTAVMLDPATCTPAGLEFNGIDLASDPNIPDEPLSAVITNQWEEGKLVFMGLQNSYYIGNGDTVPDADFVVMYDLDMPVPPDWISLLPPSFGQVMPNDSGSFMVRLRSLMEDTVVTAVVRISSNDIAQPMLIIPVDFAMLPAIVTSGGQVEEGHLLSLQVFPNPVADNSRISFTLGESGRAELVLFDIAGNQARKLLDAELASGKHQVNLETSGLQPGTYFCLLKTPGNIQSIKLIKH